MPQNAKFLRIVINTVLLCFFLSVISIATYYLSSSEKPINLLLIIVVAVIPTYSLLIQPLYYFLVKDKSLISSDLRDSLIRKGFSPKIKIISIKTNNKFFTTGTILFSNTILIEKTLLNNLSNEDIEAIVYHEVAHLKKKHLLILYLSNLALTILCFLIFYVKSNFIDIYFNVKVYEAITVFITGILLGFLFAYLPTKIKHMLDCRADVFASKKVGKQNYIKALNNLDNIISDSVSVNPFVGLKLLKRINNIKTNSYEV